MSELENTIVQTNVKVKKVKKVVEKVPQDDVKYIVLLKFLNEILVNLGKPQIDDITKFAGVTRDDLIQDVNKVTLENMRLELFSLYDKRACGYYKKGAQGLVANVIKGMLKSIGYKLNSVKTDINISLNGRRYRTTGTVYNIS